MELNISKRRTIADRLSEYSDIVAQRLKPLFNHAKQSYPPRRVALVALKEEKLLELWDVSVQARLVHRFPIFGASGQGGPKLKEGDRQVPEGFYRVSWLNPESRFHLSLKLDYPNAFDQARASEEGRSGLGGDIFIHGGTTSVGCLAIGDDAAADLFVLAAQMGIENIEVIIAPLDFRRCPIPKDSRPWVTALYLQLSQRLAEFKP